MITELFFVNVAYAAGNQTFDQFLTKVNNLIVNPLILLLFALAMVYFVYGIVEFMSNQENEEKRTQGKQHMIWGIVGLVIMMGVFMIMNMIIHSLNINYITPETGKVNLPPAS